MRCNNCKAEGGNYKEYYRDEAENMVGDAYGEGKGRSTRLVLALRWGDGKPRAAGGLEISQDMNLKYLFLLNVVHPASTNHRDFFSISRRL